MLYTDVALLCEDGIKRLVICHNMKHSNQVLTFEADDYRYTYVDERSPIEYFFNRTAILDLSNSLLISKEYRR